MQRTVDVRRRHAFFALAEPGQIHHLSSRRSRRWASCQEGGDSVGVWVAHRPTEEDTATEFAIDLLVPASISPDKGRRAARLPGHNARAARIVWGLEGEIADAYIWGVGALDASDGRNLDVRVAGPAALPVAKLHKIRDRSGTVRSTDKDALDVLRLRRGTAIDELADRMQQLIRNDNERPVAEEALDLLVTVCQSCRREDRDCRPGGALGDPAEISSSCEALSGDLLEAMLR